MRRLAVPTEKHVVLVGPNIAVVDQLREKQNIDFPVGSRSRFHSLPQSCNVAHDSFRSRMTMPIAYMTRMIGSHTSGLPVRNSIKRRSVMGRASLLRRGLYR